MVNGNTRILLLLRRKIDMGTNAPRPPPRRSLNESRGTYVTSPKAIPPPPPSSRAAHRGLSDFLKQVDSLFPPDKGENHSYHYTLGKFPSCWCFSVVNSWHKWLDLKYETKFYGTTPELAVGLFLAYVKANQINVKKLCHE